MSDATQTHSHQGTPAKNIRRSRTQWQRIMQKYKTSGLSQPAFCAQEGFAQNLFCKWRKTLISSCRPALIDDSDKLFVEVPAVDRETQPVLQWDVELAFANGMVMRLRQGQFAALGSLREGKLALSATEFSALVEGLDVVIQRRRKRYALRRV